MDYLAIYSSGHLWRFFLELPPTTAALLDQFPGSGALCCRISPLPARACWLRKSQWSTIRGMGLRECGALVFQTGFLLAPRVASPVSTDLVFVYRRGACV